MKKYLVVLTALALAAGTAGAALADKVPSAKECAMYYGKSASWLAGEAVETGAVPGKAEKSDPSLIDTHFDPFSPGLRDVDRSTGG